MNEKCSVFALGTDGTGATQVYVWGSNSCGQLGLGSSYFGLWSVGDRNTPTLLRFPAGFKLEKLVINPSHTFALGRDGTGATQVYACGVNRCGQLGLETNREDRNTPTLLRFPVNITQIKLVFEFDDTLAIGKDLEGRARVFAWGSGGSYLGYISPPGSRIQRTPKEILLSSRRVLNSLSELSSHSDVHAMLAPLQLIGKK